MGKGFNRKLKYGDISWGDKLKLSLRGKRLMDIILRVNILGVCSPDEIGVLGQALNGHIQDSKGILCTNNGRDLTSRNTKLLNWTNQFIEEKGWVHKPDNNKTAIQDIIEHLEKLGKLCPSLILNVTISEEEEYKADIIKERSHALDQFSQRVTTTYQVDQEYNKEFYAIKTIKLFKGIVTMHDPENTYLEWFTEEEINDRSSDISSWSYIDNDRNYSPQDTRLKNMYYEVRSRQHSKKI